MNWWGFSALVICTALVTWVAWGALNPDKED